jgi:two-component system, chemotaxis family, sensor kinase CheA
VNDRRRALVGKFRASAAERVRRMITSLAPGREEELSSGLQELRRDLHTLKGESMMLGFSLLSDVFHAAEDRLERAVRTPGEVRSGAGDLAKALEVVHASLIRPELDDAALERAKAALSEDPDRAAANGRSERAGVEVSGEGEASVLQVLPTPSEPRVETTARREKREKWVQVPAGRIDDLCERAADFEVGFRELHYRLREILHARSGIEARLRALLPDVERASSTLEEITGSAWALRLVHLEPAISELVAHARDIAARQGKELRVVVRAGDVQIERTVLDVIWEPLMHLVRNAVDHGIEPSSERVGKGEPTLTIEAETVGALVRLSISDNGRGIDVAKLRAAAVARGLLSEAAALESDEAAILDVIFLHGFSTRATVSELSGRGIGLDVVRSSVESLGGSVRVASERGVGTEFILSIPATISKERALVFKVGAALYALPSRTIATIVQLKDAEVIFDEAGRSLRMGDDSIPLRSMAAALGRDEPRVESWAAIVEVATHRIAFAMERPLGELALLRRPVDKVLALAGSVNGCAILEDGRIVLILAPAGLLRVSERRGDRHLSSVPSAIGSRPLVLVVDDSAVVRDLMAQVLDLAGFEVAVASGGTSGLAGFLESRPSAVLLDVDMPDLDGFEVLRSIRRSDAAVPVVMLSMRASAADRERAANLGATAYFVKSQFEETTLVDALRRYVGTA